MTKQFPEVPYNECHKPQKKLIGGTCIYLGLFGAHGKCSLENYKKACKPFQKYLKELRKEPPP